MADRIEQILYRIEAETRQFDSQVAASEQKIRQLGETMTGKGVPATGAMGAALTGVATTSGKADVALRGVARGVAALGVEAGPARLASNKLVEILAAMGVGGVVITAVVAGIALVATLYDRLTKKTRELTAEVEKFADAQLKAAKLRLDPNAELREGIDKTRQRIAALKGDLAEFRAQSAAAGKGGNSIFGPLIERTEKEIARLGKALDAAREDIPRKGRELIENLQRELAAGGDPLAARIAEVEAQVKRREIPEDEGVAAIVLLKQLQRRAGAEKAGKAAEKLAAFRLQIQQLAAGSTVTARDDLGLAVAKIIAEAKDAKLPADELTALATALSDLMSLTAQLEEFEQAFADLDQNVVEGLGFESLENIASDFDTLLVKVRATQAIAKDGAKFEGLINRIIERRTKLLAEANEKRSTENVLVGAVEDAEQKVTKTLEEQVRVIAQVARGVLGVAQAFGIVNDQATAALQNVINIGDALPGILAGKPEAIAQGLGAFAGLIGGIFGGESPEEKARKQALQENTRQLAKLTERIGDFGRFSVPESDRARLEKALADLQAQRSILVGGKGDVALSALERHGVDIDVLRQIAQELRIDLVEHDGKVSRDAVAKVLEGLRNTEPGQFAGTGSDKLREFQETINALDITDPIKQFEQLRKSLKGVEKGTGALDTVLEGIDLSTPEGVARARADLQRLFLDLTSGALKGQLGGLNEQEFLDAIKQAKAIVDATTAGIPGTGGFNVDRSITEVTGSELRALARTSNLWLQEIARNTAATALQLGATGITAPNITAPSLTPLTSTGPAQITFEGGINIEVTIEGAVSSPQAAGEQIGTIAATEIRRVLGEQLRFFQISQGTGVRV